MAPYLVGAPGPYQQAGGVMCGGGSRGGGWLYSCRVGCCNCVQGRVKARVGQGGARRVARGVGCWRSGRDARGLGVRAMGCRGQVRA